MGDRKSLKVNPTAMTPLAGGFDQVKDSGRSMPAKSSSSTNALRERVSLLREQAAVNMKAAMMKVPESWKVSVNATPADQAKSVSDLHKYASSNYSSIA